MGVSQITYWEVVCDYPTHVGDPKVKSGVAYHRTSTTNPRSDQVICNNCWDNRMTVEDLLIFLKVGHWIETPEKLNGLTED